MNNRTAVKWARRLGLALVAGLLLALYVPLSMHVAISQSQPTAEVAAARLHIRSGPGLSYTSLTTVGQGDVVTLLGRDSASAWAKVRTAAGVEGWAGTALLDPSAPFSTLPALEQVQPQVSIAPPRLNVRAGPGASYAPVATLGAGEVVNVVGRSLNYAWLYVNYGGDSRGWIASGEITPAITLRWLPVVDAPALIGGATATPAPGATAGPAPTALARGVTGTGRAGYPPIRVNTAAGVDHGTITTLDAGEPVQILGRAAELDWYYIFLRGDTLGWAAASDIVTGASLASIPVVPQTLPVGENQPPPSGGAAPVSPTGLTATVTAFRLNVRGGPGMGYSVIDVVTRGQALPILARDSAGGWLQVRTPSGKVGWVGAGYTDESGAVGRAPVEAPSRPTAVVTTGALNVRKGPGPSYEALKVVYQGERLTLTGRIPSGEWVRVVAGGVEGWVDASFIEAGSVLSTLPILRASAGDF